MIVIAYPCATGGQFIASLVALLVHGSNNNILDDGSVHGSPEGFRQYHVEDTSNDPGVLDAEWEGFQQFLATNASTVIVSHMRNLAKVAETYTDSKIIYLTIASEKWKDLQEQNFIQKIMRAFWSERWYKIYQTPDSPEFNPDIDAMPASAIDRIVQINRNYINTWKYILPESTERLLNLDISCVLNPAVLLDQLTRFLEVTVSQQRHNQALHFINEYVKINNYDNR